jgi:hypothetical protein
MRFSRTQDMTIKLPGNVGFSLDRWEVFLGGGVLCLVVGTVVKQAELLVWIGIVLLVLWVAITVLVTRNVINSQPPQPPREGGGTAPNPSTDAPSAH